MLLFCNQVLKDFGAQIEMRLFLESIEETTSAFIFFSARITNLLSCQGWLDWPFLKPLGTLDLKIEFGFFILSFVLRPAKGSWPVSQLTQTKNIHIIMS